MNTEKQHGPRRRVEIAVNGWVAVVVCVALMGVCAGAGYLHGRASMAREFTAAMARVAADIVAGSR